MFILFIPYIIDKEFATLSQQDSQILLLRYLHYNIAPNIPESFSPQGIIITELIQISIA